MQKERKLTVKVPAGIATGQRLRLTGEGEAGPGSLEGPPDDVPVFEFVENPPVPIRQVVPGYPEIARRAGLEGTVYLSLLVDRDGTVKQVRLVRSDYEVFTASAVEAAWKWIFRPGETGGGTVAAWVSVPFRFKLNEER